MTDQPPSKPPTIIPIDVMTLIAAVSVTLAVLATGVALSYSGMPVEAIVALLTGLSAIVGTLVAILSKLATVHRVNAVQDQKLQKIETQTNGALTETIRSEVDAALKSALANVMTIPMQAPVHTTVENQPLEEH